MFSKRDEDDSSQACQGLLANNERILLSTVLMWF